MFKNFKFEDDVKGLFGTSDDLQISHNGTNTDINNFTGNLNILNAADDGDIVFTCDDGSGGNAEYFRLDGSTVTTVASKQFKFEDDIKLFFGTGADSAIYASSDHLIIEQTTDDKDIALKCDDGSGGVTAYITLDGSQGFTTAQKTIRFDDGAAAQFGGDADLRISHNGTDSFITNHTGDLKIIQNTDDADIIFQCDDGSGGVTEYFRLDKDRDWET